MRRDFSEMTDDCEMLMELWATGELDSDEYNNHTFLPIVYCFAEVKGNKIKLPSEYKTCCKNFGKKTIYSLEKDSIKLILNNVDDEKIFDYFNEEGTETKYIILGNYIELNILANNTLGLHNGDIVELCIDDETKY